MLENPPLDRESKSGWLKAIARDEELALVCGRVIGLPLVALEQPFACVLHGGCAASLTRGRNGEIVYRDTSLDGIRRGFQTLPELRAAIATGIPQRLQGLQIALWRLRILHDAQLITLPTVAVPAVAAESDDYVRAARDGFELLVRCRWWLDPGEPVSFSRRFAEAWCGLPRYTGRDAIAALLAQGVQVRAGEAASGFRNPTYLYLPGAA